MMPYSYFIPGSAVAGVDDNDENKDEWVVFDVSFGVPLFDTNVNEAVCQSIQSQRLLTGVCHVIRLN